MLVRDHETAINSDSQKLVCVVCGRERERVGPRRKGCPGSNRLGLRQWGEAHSWACCSVTGSKLQSHAVVDAVPVAVAVM
ncbi:hypothetical protein VNO80_21905 [Phaseolus coccineus]|uniref:Uncharacterized protein n=1 Tax=Phaseolus coccineus TaxID=3886 RepID=A0AAN9QRC1_PHACN